MKRTIFLLLMILFVLSGCSVSEEMNLAVFIENYNEISGYELDFTSFTGQVKENNTEYSFFIEKGSNKVFIKLIDENKIIKECKIMLVKFGSDNKASIITKEHKEMFQKTVKEVVYSYVREEDRNLEKIILSLTDDTDASEKTVQYKNYKLIFISNNLCSEFIIRNKWSFEDETTDKPENKNSFWVSAPIRTETVPHR